MEPSSACRLLPLRVFAASIDTPPDTVYRWGTRGVLAKEGVLRVRLKLTRMTNGWGTSQADYNSFIAAINRPL